MLIIPMLLTTFLQGAEMPAAVAAVLRQSDFSAKYQIITDAVPRFASGDFNADRLKDTVVPIRSRKTGRSGLAFVLQGQRRPLIVGADAPFANEKDLDPSVPLDEWKVVLKGELKQLVGHSVASRGDAVFVREKEAGSGIIYLTSRGIYWIQLGD